MKDQKSIQIEEISNVNVTGDDVQKASALNANETSEIQSQLNENKPLDDMANDEHMKEPNLENNMERKGVTFNEKENSIHEFKDPWSNTQLHPNDEKKNALMKSILHRRKNKSRPNNIDEPAEHPDEDESDVNITETLKELKNKVFKKIENQRKNYLKHRRQNPGKMVIK